MSNLLQAQANYAAAQANAIATQKQLPVLKAQREVAQAQLEQAHAAQERADANLSRTLITAPVAGRVTRLTAAKGNYAAVGQALMMFVPREVWVTANFKETQLLSVRPGDPVDIRLDTYPHREFKGHVDSIQAGSGTAFSLLPALRHDGARRCLGVSVQAAAMAPLHRKAPGSRGAFSTCPRAASRGLSRADP